MDLCEVGRVFIVSFIGSFSLITLVPYFLCAFVPLELPQQHFCKEEEVLSDQDKNPSLDQDDPEPPQIEDGERETLHQSGGRAACPEAEERCCYVYSY